MNDRIRELAEDCDFYIGNEHWDKSHEEQEQLFLEKFAQLIVQECARIGELKEQGYNEYDTNMSVGWYMRQYFKIPE